MEKQLSQNKFSGRTVNERLFHAGLIHDFDKSIDEQDEANLRVILEKVFLSQDNIEVIVEKYIKN